MTLPIRRKNVRRKLNAMALEFQDKNVLLVDGNIHCKTISMLLYILNVS